MIELRIYEQKDRLEVATILIKNGYDVGQHKRKRTETGKSVDYFLHAELMEDKDDAGE